MTYLNPFIGHHEGDIVGKICAETGKSVRDVVLERGLLSEEELDDIFSVEIPGKLASCLDLNIYNRWGQLIYKSYGNVVSWDGYTPDGTKVPDGSYFYTIDIKEKTYKGHINIFR